MDQRFLEEQLKRIRRLSEQVSEVRHRLNESRDEVMARQQGGRGRWPPEDGCAEQHDLNGVRGPRR
jgi:hypothetical protein